MDNKSYEQIMEDKDIKSALEYMKPRISTIRVSNLLDMVIEELKDKGIIEKEWWENAKD